jgi:NitT/TauT family transport system substrate-binding protein
MKYRFPGARTAAAAVAAALLSGGCASVGGMAQPSSLEKHDLTVAAVPVADSSALYIAEQRGLFQAAGLKVKIVPAISGATAIAGQLAGKYDAVLGNYVSYMLSESQGDKFQILAPGSTTGPGYSMLLVPPHSRVQTVAALKGKTIGVNALNNVGTLLISSVLSDNGMSVQADHIHFKAVPLPEMMKAMQSHSIDAAWMVEPFVTNAEMAGAQPLTDTNQGNTLNFPMGGYVVTQSWVQRYPKTAAAFQHALLEGQQIAAGNSPAVWRGLEAFAGMPAPTAEMITLPNFPPSVEASSLQRVADLMLAFNMVNHKIDTGQMIP